MRHFRRPVQLAFRQAFAGQAYAHLVGHQLQQVAVTGHNHHAHAARRRQPAKCAQHIIRFVALHFKNWNIECLHHFANALQLCAQVIGHFVARALVGREQLVAEGFPQIEADGDEIRPFLFQQAQQHGRKAVHTSGRFAAARCAAEAGAG